MMQFPLSIVILTLNEEQNIEACIRSCSWCDDIHVLDSGSTDRTCELAKQLGAQVHVHAFRSFGDQRNWAIDNIPCKYQWHFHLDADERFTPQLLAEIAGEIGKDGNRSEKGAYLVPSKMIFMGKWIKHAGSYPSYQVRLFHRDRCRFTDFGHGQREVCTAEVARLKNPYIHFNFSKGLNEWLYKHNGYSSREAMEALAIREQGRPRLRDLFSGDPTSKRRAMKNLSYFFFGRAWLRFFYLYLLRGGILDGKAGFHYCAMISMYEYWIELKISELEEPWSKKTAALARRNLSGFIP